MARPRAVLAAVAVAAVSGTAAAENVACRSDAHAIVCRIDEPDVRVAEKAYPTVSFQAGDRVSIRAGGCVQTGGWGQTWKRYVDPLGPGSDRLYHGLIHIPGGTGGLRRISDFAGRTVIVRRHAVPGAALQLGYEDDDHHDNRYDDRPDEGVGGQCRGIGKAFVELTVTRGDPPEDACVEPGTDTDRDGLSDACEEAVARSFAPVVYHSNDESNFPTEVDAFLRVTSLRFRNRACGHDEELAVSPTQRVLIAQVVNGDCGDGVIARSDGTRSLHKARTFYLADVPRDAAVGSLDSSRWATYVHVYPRGDGGIVVQYWRFYAFNDAGLDHGGDWEGASVVLGADRLPISVMLLGHSTIVRLNPSQLDWEGDHPVVYSEGGGHASRESGVGIETRGCNVSRSSTARARACFIRQETWPHGSVSWPDGRITPAGPLVALGERSRPRPGCEFIRYSGLWGSPSTLSVDFDVPGLGAVSGASSGYWGPAFNETEMETSGFVTAWCEGIAATLRASECYPANSAP